MKPNGHRLILLLLAALACQARAGVERVTRVTQSPVQFGRTDWVVILTAGWEDPYRSDDVRLDMRLRSPSGKPVAVPAFFEAGSSGAPSVWGVRFAPAEAGTYQGAFELVSRDGTVTSGPFSFTVASSRSRGFLHAGGPWVFRFDDGTPFRGVGENLCWESRSHDDSRFFRELQQSLRFNYASMLGELSASGGDFTRIWMCPWNLPLEWRKVSPDTDRYSDDPGHFNGSAIRRMDDLVETLGASGVYAMLTLESHVSLLGAGWERSNYNAANGGPCARPADFFTNPAARRQFRDRLRYIVARWGYSPNLAAWEFFNEVDNAMYGQKPERIPDADVASWHAEMSAYLKQVDPYGHLVTTSVSHRDVERMDQIASIDFNQHHIYRHTDTIAATLRRRVRDGGKPYVIGEFGYEWDWSKNFSEFSWEMDNDFREGLWLGLFSPTPILPMSWWWEYFDERGTTHSIAAVREVCDRMLAAGRGSFSDVACGAPGLTCLAVRCGSTTFVYLSNPTKARASGTPRVEAPPAASAAVFDPGTGSWSDLALGRGADGSPALPPFLLEAGQRRIVELR
jgi:hypothetical protein